MPRACDFDVVPQPAARSRPERARARSDAQRGRQREDRVPIPLSPSSPRCRTTRATSAGRNLASTNHRLAIQMLRAASLWCSPSTSRAPQACDALRRQRHCDPGAPGSMWGFYLIGEYGLTAAAPSATSGMKPSVLTLYHHLTMIEGRRSVTRGTSPSGGRSPLTPRRSCDGH